MLARRTPASVLPGGELVRRLEAVRIIQNRDGVLGLALTPPLLPRVRADFVRLDIGVDSFCLSRALCEC